MLQSEKIDVLRLAIMTVKHKDDAVFPEKVCEAYNIFISLLTQPYKLSDKPDPISQEICS
jgi:hypothetical protein